jgi:hypothetical protein
MVVAMPAHLSHHPSHPAGTIEEGRVTSPLKNCEEACQKLGIVHFEISTGGKHGKVNVWRNGQRRVVTFSLTPSCKFAHHKVERDLRRVWRELGG